MIIRGAEHWSVEGLDERERENQEFFRRKWMQLVAEDERCVVAPNASAQATALYQAYKTWCEESGERVETQKRFGMRLTERGFEREKAGVYYWLGIGLRYDGDDGPGPSGPSGPKNTISSSKPVHEGVIDKKGPKGPKGPDDARGMAPELAGFLEDPPPWWIKQATVIVRDGYPAGSVKALSCSTSSKLYGTAERWGEVAESVQEYLEGRANS